MSRTSVVNSAEKCEVKPHDLAMQLVPQLSPGFRRYVLLVADAPADILGTNHRSGPTPLSGPEWLRDQDPFASLDLATLGSAHVLSGLSCCGSVTSEVVGLGWTRVTGFCTLGVGSPGLLSLVPLSAFGTGPSRVLSVVTLSPLFLLWSLAERLLVRVSCLRAIV
jgi:hypothetical protein